MDDTYAQIPDEQLMLRYRDGDSRAFEVLYRRHKDGLFSFIYRQCFNTAVAAELAHDVWTNLIRARNRYQPTAKFTTYLYNLARHRLIDHHRQDARCRTFLAAGEPLPDAGCLADKCDPGPEQRTFSRAQIERVSQQLNHLPAPQREAFLLFAEGMGVPEIAEITDAPQETARSRLRYALAKLRTALGDDLP
jgi:RNA polymerase sigma-70 factor (ECF subfamily)